MAVDKSRDGDWEAPRKRAYTTDFNIRKYAKMKRTKKDYRYRCFIDVDDIKSTIGRPETEEYEPEASSMVEDSAPADVISPTHDRTIEYSREPTELPEPVVNYTTRKITVAHALDEYDPIAFKNKLIYLNNGMEIPQAGEWKSIDECAKEGQNTIVQFWIFFGKKIHSLLMKNDPFLTYADVKIIYDALKKYLEVKDYEYFYVHHFKYEKF